MSHTPKGAIQRRGASTVRRLVASVVDGGVVILLAGLPFVVGLMSWRVFVAPDELFWPDHLLVLVANRPTVFVHPVLFAVAVGCLWHFVWVALGGGRTPGMRVAGLVIVDGFGAPPSLTAAALRTLGHVLSALALGLGWLWVFVSAQRRSWSDLASDTWLVRARSPRKTR